ncbi:uncharacterized protein LOC113126962 isoform X2 [Mastacembelus armatus]|uniref:uncharacterized protein LOC113126962 isoform X2 n=1 Tax=Mastacembelus armatus TaxID=205130 RepID=UPI000E45A6D9|nr:uncharacterized protein LOC113126962 isoform X2 [Mastacembelus armatus]
MSQTVRMRVNVCCCLLALVLGCKATAEIIHRVITEKETVSLSCPHPETKVTWSRWTDGRKVDVFTVDGDREIRHNDPGRRYNVQADKSLYIHKAAASDSGTYWCNNERAAELTVIPSGTNILDVTERTSRTLSCPPGVGGPHGPTWTRSIAGKQQQVQSEVSPADRTLTITNLQPGHSGLYYCDGKAAVYLNVSKDERSDRETPTTTTTAATTTAAAWSPSGQLGLVLGITVPLVFLLLVFIIVYFTCFRSKRQEREPAHLYCEVQNTGSQCQPAVDQSTQSDHVYSIIPDHPPTGTKGETFQTMDYIYSDIYDPWR